MTMSIADLLDDWFESPQVKGALAVNGVIGTWAGPCEPGTAYVMAHHSIGDIGDGHLGNWGFQEGGMGAVADAIGSAAREQGATVRTGARVARVLLEGGRASGVVLDNGEEIRVGVVVTSLHPQTAFLAHVGRENLPDDFVSDIEHWKSRSGVVKINLALAELPDFTADPGTSLGEHHTGSVEMAPSMEYIERAFQDAREGRPAARPFSDGVIPTSFDKTLSPEGTHIMSLFTQWVPDGWHAQPHTEELRAYADRMIDCYNEVAPNFKSSILHTDIVGPYDMEHDYGLIGGNIFHGELSLEQLFHMRPAPGYADYRTPCPACTTPVRPPTRAAVCVASPGCRRPRRPSPTRKPPAAGAPGDPGRRVHRAGPRPWHLPPRTARDAGGAQRRRGRCQLTPGQPRRADGGRGQPEPRRTADLPG
jgi:phytoene dehydrogenase-like protein